MVPRRWRFFSTDALAACCIPGTPASAACDESYAMTKEGAVRVAGRRLVFSAVGLFGTLVADPPQRRRWRDGLEVFNISWYFWLVCSA
jgi:hypothetical protein